MIYYTVFSDSISSISTLKKGKVLTTQLCPTLWDPMDWSLPGSSVHGILQARVLEWVTILFSRGLYQPKNWTRVSCTAGRFFTIWATREAPISILIFIISSVNFRHFCSSFSSFFFFLGTKLDCLFVIFLVSEVSLFYYHEHSS